MRILMVVLLLAGTAWSALADAQSPSSRRCDGASDRQFDFWVGAWDVFEHGGSTKAADVRVEKILDGRVLRERHDGNVELLVRAPWIPDGAGVRQTAQVSADAGKTWRPWFDLDFRPRRG